MSILILFIPFPPKQIKQSKYFCFIGKLFQLIQHDKKYNKIDNENKISSWCKLIGKWFLLQQTLKRNFVWYTQKKTIRTNERTNKSRVRKNSTWTTIHGECMFRTKRNRHHEQETRPTINQRICRMEWNTQRMRLALRYYACSCICVWARPCVSMCWEQSNRAVRRFQETRMNMIRLNAFGAEECT